MSAMILTGGGWTEDTREIHEYSCAGKPHIYDNTAHERYVLGMDRAIALCTDCAYPA